MLVMLEQALKAYAPMEVTEAETLISVRPVQFWKAL